MMDLRRLRLLRELRARGTVAAVAEALSYSPSAVSQQLAELQREAGVVLLERAGRRLRLTDAAHVLAGHADALLARMEQAEAELAAAGPGVTGVVRVASFQTAAIGLVPSALRALAEAHPALRVEVTEAETSPALEALVLQETDLVIGVEYEHVPAPRPAGIVREDLFADPLRIALPRRHRLARPGGPVPVARLAEAAWAAGYPDTGHAAMITRVARELGGFDPDIRHQANDLLIMTALVGSGQAVTLLPDMVRPGRGSGVVTRELAEARVARQVFLAMRAAGIARPALAAVRSAVISSRSPGAPA